jgi:hypothetical protein
MAQVPIGVDSRAAESRGKVAILAAVLWGVPLLISAAPSSVVVGFATTQKPLRVNGHAASGNVTLFEGDALESQDAACRVHARNGASCSLADKSRIRVSADSVNLDAGSIRIFGYTANARGLTVRADRTSSGTVSVAGGAVEVSGLTGTLHVFNSRGAAIANLSPGQTVNFKSEGAGKADDYSLTGCIASSGKSAFLTDVTSGITVELRGIKVPSGRVVTVNGKAISGGQMAPGATQIVSVESFKQLPGSCRQLSRAGAGVAAGTAAGAAAGAAVSVTSSSLGLGIAGAAGAGATAVVAGVVASGTHTAVGVAATSASNGPTNCVSPCFLH